MIALTQITAENHIEARSLSDLADASGCPFEFRSSARLAPRNTSGDHWVLIGHWMDAGTGTPFASLVCDLVSIPAESRKPHYRLVLARLVSTEVTPKRMDLVDKMLSDFIPFLDALIGASGGGGIEVVIEDTLFVMAGSRFAPVEADHPLRVEFANALRAWGCHLSDDAGPATQAKRFFVTSTLIAQWRRPSSYQWSGVAN